MKNTFSKAAIVGQLSNLNRKMAAARQKYDEENGSSKKTDQAFAAPNLMTAFNSFEQEIFSLTEGIRSQVADECSLGNQYNHQSIMASIGVARSEVHKRFSHFPIAAAMLETFLMYFETNLNLNCHFLSLRDTAACEDRMIGNPSCYGLDGQPNAKGRNECDHCPHKV